MIEIQLCNDTREKMARKKLYLFALQAGLLLLIFEAVTPISSQGCRVRRFSRFQFYRVNQTFSPLPCLRCKCNPTLSISCNRVAPAAKTGRTRGPQVTAPFCGNCNTTTESFKYACKTCVDNLRRKTYLHAQTWKVNTCTSCQCTKRGAYCKIAIKQSMPWKLPKLVTCRSNCNIANHVRRFPCKKCYFASTRKYYLHGKYWRVGGTCVHCQCFAGRLNCARDGLVARITDSGKMFLRRAPTCRSCGRNRLKSYVKRYNCKTCYNDVTNARLLHRKGFNVQGLFTCNCFDGIINCRKAMYTIASAGMKKKLLKWYCRNCTVSESISKFKSRSCTFQNQRLENGKNSFVGFGNMPYCMKCFCFDTHVISCIHAVRLNSSIPKTNIFRAYKICLSSSSCNETAQSVSTECQRDVSLNCYMSPPIGSSWLANGCNYSCTKENEVKRNFIRKPWCQSLSTSDFCAICPDKEKFFRKYGSVYKMCKIETKLISREQDCDGVNDCENKTDEAHCSTYYCKSIAEKVMKKTFIWRRSAVNVTKYLPCFHLNPHWKGLLQRTCSMKMSGGTFWPTLDYCQCQYTRKEPTIMEELSRDNVTVVMLKENAWQIYNYSVDAVSQKRSIQLAMVLIEKALNVTFKFSTFGKPNSNLTDFSQAIYNILQRPRWCSEADAYDELKSKWKLFKRRYGISVVIAKSAAIKTWSLYHSDFLQDILFPDKNPLKGTDVDSFQVGKERGGPKPGITMFGFSNGTNTRNQSIKARVIQVKLNVKKKAVDTHIRVQLILDISFAMISLLALIIAVILLFGFNVPSTTKLFIHKNLFVARIISTFIYVLGSWIERDLKKNRGICTTFMIFQYCTSMATFSWMLVEGINLFNVIVFVFQTRWTNHKVYAAIGWGLPLLSFIVAIASKSNAFLQSPGCISLGTIGWLFRGPVAILLGINFVLFCLILWFILKNISSSQRLKTSPQKLRSTTRAFMTLIPILGVTEILGFGIESSPVVIGYLYIIINGCLVGLLFPILHCFNDPQVKEAVQKFQKRRKKSTQNFSNQPMDKSSAISFSTTVPNDNKAFVYDTKL